MAVRPRLAEPPIRSDVLDFAASPPPDVAKSCVIVPFMDAILAPVEDGLRELERMGIKVFRRAGCSAIDFARSALASLALIEGYESILFIDSDVLFNPADALRLLGRPEPIVAGVYAQKKYGHLNLELMPGTESIPFGDRGIDMEVKSIGAGFLRVRAEAFQAILQHHGLPVCTGNGPTLWPWFLPTVIEDSQTQVCTYLCEDYSFCLRAREAGIKIIADTRINLQHLGLFPYTFLEASTPRVARPRGGIIPAFFPVADHASDAGKMCPQ